MLDSSSLFAVEAFKISNGHWRQIGQRRSRYSTTILVLFANAQSLKRVALKVSAVPGATHNRIGSNRYRNRSAGAGVGPPGETQEAVNVTLARVGFPSSGTGNSNPSPSSSAESVANLNFGAHSIGEPKSESSPLEATAPENAAVAPWMRCRSHRPQADVTVACRRSRRRDP
jgi:hypothetical protein